MDDLTARVGRLETTTAEMRADVAAIKATLPHLATRSDLADLRVELKGDIGRLEARLEAKMGGLEAKIGRVDGNIARSEASLIKWIVGAAIACTGVASGIAFSAAKLIH